VKWDGVILLESHCNFIFYFQCLTFVKKSNADGKINIFLGGVFATEKGPAAVIQKSTPHVHD
jgi:hypothetical protein